MDEEREIFDGDREIRAARRAAVVGSVLTAAFLSAISLVAMVLSWPGWGYAGPLLALLCAALTLHFLRFREYLRRPRSRASAAFVAVAVPVGLAMCVLGQASAWTGWAWATVPALLLGDVVAGRSKRAVTLWVSAAAASVFGGGLLVGPALAARLPIWIAPGIAAFYIASMWSCNIERNWWLRSLVRIDESRRVAAELATARERLRLADDLHDILGHALEVVAFKSELAARTVPSGAENARREMDEAARVARDAMSEVRSLAADRRPTDLVRELAGARAVLDSAGVGLEVRGEPGRVPEPVQDVLGRVLREAMTNVLRHADASRCVIGVSHDSGPPHAVTLWVDNDGAADPRSEQEPPSGSGLRGLERQVTSHGGTFSARRGEHGEFSLRATVPAPTSDAAAPGTAAV